MLELAVVMDEENRYFPDRLPCRLRQQQQKDENSYFQGRTTQIGYESPPVAAGGLSYFPDIKQLFSKHGLSSKAMLRSYFDMASHREILLLSFLKKILSLERGIKRLVEIIIYRFLIA